MSLQFSLEDILNVLISLEKTGSSLYFKLSEVAIDLETVKLFKWLSEQEKAHQALYEAWKAERYELVAVDEDYHQYLQSLIKATFDVLSYSEQAEMSYPEGIVLAKSLEKDTLIFLSECDYLLGGKKKELIERIKSEERKHLKKLYDLG